MAGDNTRHDGSDTPVSVDDPKNFDNSTDISARTERSDSKDDQGFNRRTFIKLVGGGIIAYGAWSLYENDTTSVDSGGPPKPSDRFLAIEDRFENHSLDADRWDVGWGWGKNTRTSSTHIVPENVTVRDGQLHLKGSHKNGHILAGSVHTRGKVTVGPGSYFEAKIKFPDRVGFLPAFWAKPNDETWPPEIDVVELFQKGDDHADTYHSQHTLHYSTSTIPGDRSTYQSTAKSYMPGNDLTENFHIYGVDWQPDQLTHYVDGEEVLVTTDPNVTKAMEKAAPFYLMCSLEINKVGKADMSESWGESVVIDWVRVWK